MSGMRRRCGNGCLQGMRAYGFFNSGIDNAGHLGGLVNGLALGALLQKPLTRTEGSSRLSAVLAYSGVSLALLLGIGAAYKSNRPFIKLERGKRSLAAGDFDLAHNRHYRHSPYRAHSDHHRHSPYVWAGA